MIGITREQLAAVTADFFAERPGPLVAAHVVSTGRGRALVDRWPAPRVVLAETAGNISLAGEAAVLAPAELQPHARGFFEAAEVFEPLLRAVDPSLQIWPRKVFVQSAAATPSAAPSRGVRPLRLEDGARLARLTPESAWITKTWGGPQGLAASGYGWCACVADDIVAVACTFFLGNEYEDIGVVTEPPYRGRGLSVACAGALCADIWARGHRPSWTTSSDNHASLSVAARLGFTPSRTDQLYVLGLDLPPAASRPDQ